MISFFTQNYKFLFLLICLLSASCGGKVISTSKDINEANAMMVALKESGIDSTRSESGEEGKIVYNVSVEDGFFSTGAELEAMRILDENCLPYNPPAPIAEGSMGVPSTSVEIQKKKRQAQIELQQLFRSYRGVTCVTAILVYPERSLDSLNPYDSSATVKVSYKTPNPPITETSIQEQTSRTVEKLKIENVKAVLEYAPVKPAELNSSESWKKLLITAIIAFVITGILMFLILWMRKGKSVDSEIEDETDLLQENELMLLDSNEDE
jgi:type III secretory pathway lipoprotein EscJ